MKWRHHLMMAPCSSPFNNLRPCWLQRCVLFVAMLLLIVLGLLWEEDGNSCRFLLLCWWGLLTSSTLTSCFRPLSGCWGEQPIDSNHSFPSRCIACCRKSWRSCSSLSYIRLQGLLVAVDAGCTCPVLFHWKPPHSWHYRSCFDMPCLCIFSSLQPG
jgi:hypothetical protein